MKPKLAWITGVSLAVVGGVLFVLGMPGDAPERLKKQAALLAGHPPATEQIARANEIRSKSIADLEARRKALKSYSATAILPQYARTDGEGNFASMFAPRVLKEFDDRRDQLTVPAPRPTVDGKEFVMRAPAKSALPDPFQSLRAAVAPSSPLSSDDTAGRIAFSGVDILLNAMQAARVNTANSEALAMQLDEMRFDNFTSPPAARANDPNDPIQRCEFSASLTLDPALIPALERAIAEAGSRPDGIRMRVVEQSVAAGLSPAFVVRELAWVQQNAKDLNIKVPTTKAEYDTWAPRFFRHVAEANADAAGLPREPVPARLHLVLQIQRANDKAPLFSTVLSGS